MLRELTKEDILKAVEELIPLLGVRELVQTHDLLSVIRSGNLTKCVEELALRMDLPIRVNLSLVPAQQTSGPDSARPSFRSSALVYTDSTGRGRESITAQVKVPDNIPLYGSDKLRGYMIYVTASENCAKYPESFIAIMVHELSHILLASLWSPFKDSELHTDLVPLLLGFRAIVSAGRKTVDSRQSGDNIMTTTTTYGYLTDKQFAIARYYIEDIVTKHGHKKDQLIRQSTRLKESVDEALGVIEEHERLLKRLDECPPNKMKPDHARHVVDIHNSQPTQQWGERISAAKKDRIAALRFARELEHYTTQTIKELTTHADSLTAHEELVTNIIKSAREDSAIMRRYAGVIFRLMNRLNNNAANKSLQHTPDTRARDSLM